MAFTQVVVTRDYDLATGAAPSGTVYFTLSDWLVNGGVTVVPAALVAPLDVAGKIAISLVVNTDPGTLPTDSYYTVREDIVGQPRRTYQIVIPSSLGGFTVELEYLTVGVDGYGISYGTSGYGLGRDGYGTGGYGIIPYGG
jgi:hypothetical protein